MFQSAVLILFALFIHEKSSVPLLEVPPSMKDNTIDITILYVTDLVLIEHENHFFYIQKPSLDIYNSIKISRCLLNINNK